MKYIKSLPINAVFDYKDLFGAYIYHTKMRNYSVIVREQFGKKVKIIRSYSLDESNRYKKY